MIISMLWLLVIPLFIYLPFLGEYWLSSSSAYSDLLITHLPNILFIRQSLLAYHQFPLWSPLILSGYPFAADPLSGVWYLPGWLAVILPAPWGINLTMLVHLLWGGIGCYLLCTALGCSQKASILGAVIFMGMPKLAAHIGAGHITLVYAVTWTPWVFFAEIRRRAAKKLSLAAIAPGICLGLIALADVRWVIPAGLSWAAFVLYLEWSNVGEIEVAVQPEYRQKLNRLLHSLGSIFAQGIFALVIAAPLLVPLVEFMTRSTRTAMNSGDTLGYSLPPGRLMGLFFPSFSSTAEWVLYLGGVPVILTLLSFFGRGAWKKNIFWWGMMGASLVLSMAAFLPGIHNLFSMPLINLLRVPSRYLFLTGFAGAVLAALTVDRLLCIDSGGGFAWRPSARLAVVALGFLCLLFSGGIWFFTQNASWSSLWGGGMVFCAGLVILIWSYRKFDSRMIWTAVLVLAIVDFGVVGRKEFKPKPAPPLNQGTADLIDRLSHDQALFRVYSPSYSIPQEIAASSSLQMADGIDPIQLRSYRTWIDAASGVPDTGYSVTVPSFQSASPETDNQIYLPDLQKLGTLNVKYLAAEFPISIPDLIPVGRYGNTYLYLNPAAKPRAWVSSGGGNEVSAASDAQITRWTPGDIQVEASGPNRLVLSEIAYPGWRVTVDGKSAQLLTALDLFRSVELPPGKHEIKFVFLPLSVILGILVGALGWGLAVYIWLAGRKPT